MELTKATIAKLTLPETGYSFVRDDDQPGLGIRISHLGSKSWILEKRVNGKNIRRTLGDAAGAAALSRQEALRQFVLIGADLEHGEDKVAAAKKIRATKATKATEAALTFESALREYVDLKRRKDKLPLKPRTKADYLAMIDAPKVLANGKVTRGGELHTIASKPLSELTGGDIRAVHAAANGERRKDYLMQVVRAVLNWHGVTIPDNPLSTSQSGKHRITIAASRSAKNAIPKANLGAWWNACDTIRSKVAADALKGLLLSGCRPVEFGGDKFGNEPLRARDVNLKDNTIVLLNTKNRRSHTIFMPTQLVEIMARNCKDKKPTDPVFDVADLGKSMRSVCKAAGMAPDAHTPSDTRSTFASIAAALVSHSAVGTMMNHTASGDVTTSHYISHGPEYLRQCWQQVADFIISCAE